MLCNRQLIAHRKEESEACSLKGEQNIIQFNVPSQDKMSGNSFLLLESSQKSSDAPFFVTGAKREVA